MATKKEIIAAIEELGWKVLPSGSIVNHQDQKTGYFINDFQLSWTDIQSHCQFFVELERSKIQKMGGSCISIGSETAWATFVNPDKTGKTPK